MNIKSTIASWAKKHKEIVGVMIGGSRIKGTHHENSDYDFSISLEVNPTPALVERLTKDLSLENSAKAELFPLSSRHFMLAGKHYFPKNSPRITLGFTNIKEFRTELTKIGNYALIDEQIEFLLSSRIVYDPKGHLKKLKRIGYPEWVRDAIMKDALVLAHWNLEKYEVLVRHKSVFASQGMKIDCLWYLLKALAALNNIPVGAKSDYYLIKEKFGKSAIMPKQFFNCLEKYTKEDDVYGLKGLVAETGKLVQERLR